MNKQQSHRMRERRLRAKYRKNIRVAIVISLIIGLVAGFVLGQFLAKKDNGGSVYAINTTASPTPNVDVNPTLSLDDTPPATQTITAASTDYIAATATAVPEASDVIVDYAVPQQLSAQINNDGTVRKTTDTTTYETLNFTLRVTRYLTPEYYSTNYSTRYQMQGDEAGVEFQLTLNDYMGTQTVIPQDLFTIGLETADGVAEQGYQLTDAEIHGENNVSIETNVPKMFYKRFKFNTSVGDMKYLTVTTVVDGVEQKYLFDLGEPIRPTPAPTPSPSPAPETSYETLSKGSKGDAVKALQEKLVELRYLAEGSADGDFGSKTEQAIKMFQADNGMQETGIADNDFQQKLFASEG